MDEIYSTETTDRFLFLYRKLEKIAETDPERYRFYREKYYERFEDYRHLRNYLSHEQYEGGYPFAVSSRVVADLAAILGHMDCLAYERAAKQVVSLSPQSTLQQASLVIAQTSHTHFPILNEQGRVVGILTAGALLSLLNEGADPSLSLDGFLGRFSLRGQKTRYLFAGRDTPLYEAERSFRIVVDGKRLSLLLLTEHGRAQESLLGILTIYDILK